MLRDTGGGGGRGGRKKKRSLSELDPSAALEALWSGRDRDVVEAAQRVEGARLGFVRDAGRWGDVLSALQALELLEEEEGGRETSINGAIF